MRGPQRQRRPPQSVIDSAVPRRYFRGAKAYYLGNRTPGQDHDSVVRLRVRSIPKRLHGSLGARHFTQNPLTNAAVVRGVCMLPTAGFQVVMATMGRTLARALNLKRKMTVSGAEEEEEGGGSRGTDDHGGGGTERASAAAAAAAAATAAEGGGGGGRLSAGHDQNQPPTHSSSL